MGAITELGDRSPERYYHRIRKFARTDQGIKSKVKSDQPINQKRKNAFAAVVKENDKAGRLNKVDVNKKENKAAKQPCLYCGTSSHHAIADCRKFAGLSNTDKSDHCKQKGLCFGCLNQGHMKKYCPNPEWAK